ncbi:aminotransferase class IV [Alteromonas sp.]|uniref:aminotransferase class IV n=1 Tax=Alteromonas sp. TaxID=232 RepID=UPI000B72B6BC|nr:aminotransferase class IV [Alteromonas sp.]MAI39479.1 D-alanine aminotransferase [Alteromonas sp.]OUX83767.1 MAG: D-alanine aminotransferase [Alteromonas sp. TMED35]|tara:strand:+ start:25288 stop:26154 length:867 start_codon:yes stop_codon:yes gene_type:complete
MTVAFLNGEYLPLSEARISPMDRGFLFGDGIYEVIPTYAGKPVGLKGHLSRLASGLSAIEIDNPYDDAMWTSIVLQLATENAQHIESGNVGVYFHVSRGTDTKRYHAYPTGVTPTVFAFAFEMAAPQSNSRSSAKVYKVALEEDKRWQRCHIKSTSLLGNVMHFQSGVKAGVNETILFNEKGLITEASSCNVFIVKNGIIKTPPLNNELLPGITRHIALESFKRANLNVVEEWFSKESLLDADEVWLTSSSKEVSPVIEIDGHVIGEGAAGEVWERAIRAYHAYKFDA